MDRLDHVLDTAGPLLRRVDEVLIAAGAPAGHDVWTQLRRVRLLPADAVDGVAALRPDVLAGAAPELRSHGRAYATVAASLPPPGDWTGEAADAYDALRRRLAGHLDSGPGSLAERLDATADLGDALTDWMRSCRGELALTLAEVLGSVEAVTLTGTGLTGPTGTGPTSTVGTGPTRTGLTSMGPAGMAAGGGTRAVPEAEVVVAAADVAARLLRTVADGQDRGAELMERSSDLAAVRHADRYDGGH